MRRRPWLVLALCVVAALAVAAAVTVKAGAGGATPPVAADTVFVNGVVYTADAGHTTASVVGVKGGRIVYVGDSVAAVSATKTVDLDGGFMLPGLVDSQLDVGKAARDLYVVDLTTSTTMAKHLRLVRQMAARFPSLALIHGAGWASTDEGVPLHGPTKQQLDAAVSDRPALMWSWTGHAVWCNTLALKQAGITATTKDPKGGVIERVPGTRIPSGTLRGTATALVTKIVPDYTVEQWKDAIRYFQQDIAGPSGLTAGADASVTAGGNALTAYEQLAQADELTVRMRGLLTLAPGNGALADQVAAAVAERAKHTSPLFQTGAVALAVDGDINGHKALLSYPYADRPGFLGTGVWPSYAALQEASVTAAQAGCQLRYHAVGDSATGQALNAIAAAEAATGSSGGRPGIAHLQLVAPTDYERFAQLKVTAIQRPGWPDFGHGALAESPTVGAWRAAHQYPSRSFYTAGASVASCSESTGVGLMYDIANGVTRRVSDPLSSTASSLMPPTPLYTVLWQAERVSRQRMIDSFTIGGARANFLEGQTGTIEVGKSADLIVLDKNILTCKAPDIARANVLLTVFRGATVYDRQQERARVSQLKENIHSLQVGVQSWAVDHDDLYPARAVVTDAGMGPSSGDMYVDEWPTNPWTGAPMKPGSGRGDYTYERLNGGRMFRLSGHLTWLRDFVVP